MEDIKQDNDFLDFLKHYLDFKEVMKVINVTDFLPWTNYFFKDRLKNFYAYVHNAKKARDKKLKEILETFDIKHLRDAVDGLMYATVKYGLNEEPNEVGLTKENVLETTVDFLGVGFDKTTSTFLWLLLYMAEYPEVQEKIIKN